MDEEKKVELEVGQTLYIHARWTFQVSDNLREYVITNIDDTNIDVSEKNGNYEMRLIRKTLSKPGIDISYQAYLTAEEYWDGVNRKKKTKELRKKVTKYLQSLDLEELTAIEKQIEKLNQGDGGQGQ